MADELGQDQTRAPAPGVVDDNAPPAPAPAPVVAIDPDDIELRDAKAAAEAEGAKAPPAEPVITPAPAAAPTPAAQPAAKPSETPEPAPAATAMIPKPRFDEVLTKNDELARQNAFLQGQIEAMKAKPADPAATPTAPAAPQQSPADRLIAVGLQIDALAKRFDAGEISYSELKKQERTLSDQETSIREELLLAKVRSNTPQAPTNSDLFLEQQTAKLEVEHPYLAAITDDKDFEWLVSKARGQLEAEKIDLPKGPVGSYRLRERIATLSDQFGEMLTGKKIELPAKPGAQPAPAPAPAPAAAPGLSAEAKARLDKMNLAASMPPAVATMTGSTGEVISEASIEHMTDDDLAALPASTRHRFLGITT